MADSRLVKGMLQGCALQKISQKNEEKGTHF